MRNEVFRGGPKVRGVQAKPLVSGQRSLRKGHKAELRRCGSGGVKGCGAAGEGNKMGTCGWEDEHFFLFCGVLRCVVLCYIGGAQCCVAI